VGGQKTQRFHIYSQTNPAWDESVESQRRAARTEYARLGRDTARSYAAASARSSGRLHSPQRARPTQHSVSNSSHVQRNPRDEPKEEAWAFGLW
jgi:hypothetical protein